MILYDFDLSAECYAVRLLAAFTGTELTLRRIDVYPGRENEGAAFLAVNPAGTVPVLEDDGLVLHDWQAILKHIATRENAGPWSLPDAAGSDDARLGEARLGEWLDFARALGESAGLARLHDGMDVAADIDRCRAEAHRLLRALDRHLWFAEREGRDWILAGDAPGIADLAIFVHAALCEEGGIERMDYPAVRRWIDRVRHLPGFIVTGGVFAPA